MKFMKIFKDPKNTKKIVRIIIYSAALITLHYIIINKRNSFVNTSTEPVLNAVESVLIVLIVRTIFLLAEKRIKSLAKKTGDRLTKILKRLFKPIIDKISENRRRKNFIKGSDESKFIFNLEIIDKLKNKLKLRKKLDLKSSSSNAEKIRLLYIKFILILTGKNYKIKYSYTPKEIKDSLDYREREEERDILFDIYEQVRYGNNDVDDDITKSVEKII